MIHAYSLLLAGLSRQTGMQVLHHLRSKDSEGSAMPVACMCDRRLWRQLSTPPRSCPRHRYMSSCTRILLSWQHMINRFLRGCPQVTRAQAAAWPEPARQVCLDSNMDHLQRLCLSLDSTSLVFLLSEAVVSLHGWDCIMGQCATCGGSGGNSAGQMCNRCSLVGWLTLTTLVPLLLPCPCQD